MKFDKVKIRAAMDDYAKKVGYPDNISVADFAKKHTNPMFNYLLGKGLVQRNWYNDYRHAAITEYKKWYIFNRR